MLLCFILFFIYYLLFLCFNLIIFCIYFIFYFIYYLLFIIIIFILIIFCFYFLIKGIDLSLLRPKPRSLSGVPKGTIHFVVLTVTGILYLVSRSVNGKEWNKYPYLINFFNSHSTKTDFLITPNEIQIYSYDRVTKLFNFYSIGITFYGNFFIFIFIFILLFIIYFIFLIFIFYFFIFLFFIILIIFYYFI